MKLSDFDFDLPEGLIATRPARPRSASRLLVARADAIDEAHAIDLPSFLNPGDRLVLNDTKVIPARLSGVRTRSGEAGVTEARIEATLLDPLPDGNWMALLKPLRKVRDGEVIRFSDALSAEVVGRAEGTAALKFNLTGDDFDAALNASGAMPLPPYIEALRKSDDQDRVDYQTIWAKRTGAVAAPTASLHFDAALMEALASRGIEVSYVTLHVGAGTFLPVKVDDIADHKMHSERGSINAKAASEINATRAHGGRIVPVGTTAMRLIETAAGEDGTLSAWEGATDIFITPGYRFKIADGLMTNFHLPKSTLMMLVSAFMGSDRIRSIYAYAISREFRFFSYGDASLLLPKG
ncbi:tRNA preQ1(34) S-adenosylmethionine ribosyltransferase-isomerase QueA [Boseongicola aestuarii]|uniref:S-adenosylmethionine:tRNA ribosyltransferase-isomerase n=1 Tax=Boseongicola aestuarii TaxID=1470561 RepID=A0A238IWD1_9RHOB|nr:tRNA preQ1(34) S-adenosylmethionine ribosyltransferase-isomerase QueA [Boseongicola aestuarii]SMX22341.1 S-adenosylmethionine:tRNA ribosyltransferase-isomerase [Boseongicola aestuarii]